MTNSSPKRALVQLMVVLAIVTTLQRPSLVLLVAWGAVLSALGLSFSKGGRT